jgi:microsomal dipeptidase-like Zn-dependent dipeptidase
MVSWQNTLNRKHDFEFLEQEYHGGGRGKGRWTWARNLDPRGQAARALKYLLAQRLRLIADRLEREAQMEAYTSMSVERFVMEQNASPLLSMRVAEKFGSTSSNLVSVNSTPSLMR